MHNNSLAMKDTQTIIKARWGSDVRKVAVYNKELTMVELQLMMQRIFRGQLTDRDSIVFKYADEGDADLVTLGDDSDLLLALQTNATLRLTLFGAHRQPSLIYCSQRRHVDHDGRDAQRPARHAREDRPLARRVRDEVGALLRQSEEHAAVVGRGQRRA